MTSAARRLVALAALAVAVAILVLVAPLQSQGPPGPPDTVSVNGHDAVAGEVLVQFADASAAGTHRALAQQIDAVENVPVGRGHLRRFRSRVFDVHALLAFFRAQRGVVFAEPNYILRAVATPNDPGFPSLWGLLNVGQPVSGIFGTPGADIKATDAWDLTTGSTANVVAVIDTGIDYTHGDLAANVWSAPAEYTVTLGGVSITCPAGSHGFNAIARTCNPMDDNNHGTHVSGTIGAVGNNGLGVAGVNWTTRIIGGKFLNASGSGSTANAIDTIEFLIQTKAAFAASAGANIRVLNNSWGGGAFSTALQNAIANAHANDMLFVAAAGNAAVNTDVFPFYPAGYDVPNVISVAATDNRDLLSGFSNYGATTVDLAAPGSSILSTVVGGGYSSFSGTSMASPHVAGAAVLVLSECALDTAGLKNALFAGVDVIPSLTGEVSTAGRLNVDRAVRTCGGPAVPSAPTGLSAFGGNLQVTLAWNASGGADTYTVKRATSSGGPYTTVATGLTTTDHVDTGLTAGVTYYYVVSAVNGLGESANSAEASATPYLSPPSSPTQLKAKPGDARVSLTWLAPAGAASYRVKRSLIKAGPYSQVGTTSATSFVDTTVTNGTTYFYVVSAVNAAGESKNSSKVSAFPAPIPAPPTGVAAATGASAGQIDRSWAASPWATQYTVRRSAVSGGPYSGVGKVTTLGTTDTSLRSGTRYFYVILAVNATGESAPSTEVSAIAR